MCAPKDDAKTKIDRLIEAVDRLTRVLLTHTQKDALPANLQRVDVGLQEA